MMKVELFAVLKNHAAADTVARQSIQRAFAGISEDVEPFLSFEDVRSFYAEMGKAFGRADVIVAAADEGSFLEQKWNMLKALGLKSEICPAVLKAIRENGSVPDASMKAHALMPKDAAVFMTSDGLYSGFAVESGKQTLLYLPMINGRTQEILEKGVSRFFAAQQNAQQPEPVAQVSVPDNNVRFAETAKILSDQGMSVAFANTQTILYVQNGVRANPLFGDSFIPANVQDNPGSRESVAERMACLADSARKEIGTTLGVAISNIYSVGMDTKELFLHVAIADSRTANVRKIVGLPGMATGDLVSLATDTLYSMLQDYAAGAEFPPEDVQIRPLNLFEEGMQPAQENREQKRGTAIKIVICVIIAVVLCVLIGIYFQEEVEAFFSSRHDEAAAAAVIEQTTQRKFELPTEVEEATEEAEEEMFPEVDMALFGTADDGGKTGGLGLSAYETPIYVNFDTDIRDYTPVETTTQAETTAAAAATTAAETTATTAAQRITAVTVPKTTASTTKEETVSEKESESETEAKIAAGALKEAKSAKPASAASATASATKQTTTTTTTAPSTTKQAATALTLAVPETTTQQSLIESLLNNTKADGTFTFTVYGYGHGVGMSQLGAIAYSRQGWSYDAIVLHYYPGTALAQETPPETVTYGGKERDMRDFLVRVVQQEIGGYAKTADLEALKAQTVAVYSFVKAKNYKVSGSDVAYSTLPDGSLSSLVRTAVDAVYGKYLTYGGKAVLATFYASSAGKTTSAQSIWGGNYAYLAGGVESPETVSVSTCTITAADFKAMIDRYNAAHASNPITLSGNPSQWIEILSHDGARGNVGYITSIRVGNKTMNGNSFRSMFNTYRPSGTAGIKSHCFSLQYN